MATLKERLDADLKDSMRAKTETRTTVIRAIKSAIKYKEVEPGASALDDAGVLTVVAGLIKKGRDSVEQFKAGNRPEMAEKEEAEIAILQSYLPQQLTPDELAAAVQASIAEVGATSSKDMGLVMKNLTPKIQGKAEGRAISEAVKAQLAKLS
ncbi:GatB/YqeY domain-containing protein [Myxococcus sp. CA051A]|uniref:GatB/YqeY domain-containing protein n=1 Tax=Myxococcus llanfairpwllgwyngyllgogerychwyrndrobwllllantysiliogogogochensis TaxID=2590453 RepID=A0A540WYU5_9BACT|nr:MULTISPECIES: GatB/YqeY domain-containing protein [Myxococcus]NTX12211.1 GatB/YqeY domain-containing protein [Myxococcus sp. CA056]NTX58417.1 GatB/YqeY domain-containing protein [Myxococcus sp. CA039A]NTX59709.1 GatB/YqeY domain-containing protein [Myxococcus sp. CA051A]TQF14185.1 GatB/YqeY domain-containing protein [Myxococcus llanfairpwllgwyngyllgogerychwyrndrobwllllantysiliogogogochensis]